MLPFQHKLFYIIFVLANFYPSFASANTVFDDELGCNCAKDLTLNKDLFISNNELKIDNFLNNKINQNTSNFISQNEDKKEQNEQK